MLSLGCGCFVVFVIVWCFTVGWWFSSWVYLVVVFKGFEVELAGWFGG